jgi:hypothetical protein
LILADAIVAAMEYFVLASDGTEYGPANLDTLKQWVREDRLRPESMLRDFHTGQRLQASQVPGLFAATAPPPAGQPSLGNWSQAPSASPYPRPGYTPTGNEGSGALWGSILRSAAAVALFFVFHGIGLFFATYAVIYAFRAKSHGNQYANIAIAISLVAAAAVLIGWILRLSTGTF